MSPDPKDHEKTLVTGASSAPSSPLADRRAAFADKLADAKRKAIEAKERLASPAATEVSGLDEVKRTLEQKRAELQMARESGPNAIVTAPRESAFAQAFPRASASAEPSKVLLGLFNLPLQQELPEPFVEALEELRQRTTQLTRDGVEQASWLPVYDEAIEVLVFLGEELKEDLRRLQQELLEAEDASELKRRLVQDPRREADEAKRSVRESLQKTMREWVDRNKRQMDHVGKNCQEVFEKKFRLDERPTSTGIEMAMPDGLWDDYCQYFKECCQTWIKNTTQGVEVAFAQNVNTGAAPLRTIGRPEIFCPPDTTPPSNRVGIEGAKPAPEVLAIPGRGKLFGQYIRSNIMSVGMFGMLVGSMLAMFGWKVGSGTIRAALIAALLPISIIFGALGVKRQRQELSEKAVADQKKKISGTTDKAVKARLDEQRQALDRWINARLTVWSNTTDQYWKDQIEPHFSELEAAAKKATIDHTIWRNSLNDKMNALRTLGARVNGTTLPELRARQRDIRDASLTGV
ncbi:MAG: hypothetical protein CO108_06755 [Deltaproteobacteria bacterium CG_4_9_14_3_um_filter_63_12]|nr:MAG: hypothetical protein CO108_06755 [Deltaproteobacteria bacterium CG_4_9_14_3_um_filter_63_12]